jgi:hypothetical protein
MSSLRCNHKVLEKIEEISVDFMFWGQTIKSVKLKWNLTFCIAGVKKYTTTCEYKKKSTCDVPPPNTYQK